MRLQSNITTLAEAISQFSHFKNCHTMHSPFDLRKPIAIGSDHAGFDLKEDLISFLEKDYQLK